MPDDSPPDAGDPRVYFAAERTLLAWIRTGLASMGFGFVVARFGVFLRELAAVQPEAAPRHPGVSLWIGTVLVVVGISVTVGAAFSHRRTMLRLQRGQPLRFQAWSLGVLVALVLAAVGVSIVAYLILSVNG